LLGIHQIHIYIAGVGNCRPNSRLSNFVKFDSAHDLSSPAQARRRHNMPGDCFAFAVWVGSQKYLSSVAGQTTNFADSFETAFDQFILWRKSAVLNLNP